MALELANALGLSAAVDALPALEFVGDDKAGALAERVLDEMRSSVRDATGGLPRAGGRGPHFPSRFGEAAGRPSAQNISQPFRPVLGQPS